MGAPGERPTVGWQTVYAAYHRTMPVDEDHIDRRPQAKRMNGAAGDDHQPIMASAKRRGMQAQQSGEKAPGHIQLH